MSGALHWLRIHRGVTESTLRGYGSALRRLLGALGEQPERYTARRLRVFVLEQTRAPMPPSSQDNRHRPTDVLAIFDRPRSL